MPREGPLRLPRDYSRAGGVAEAGPVRFRRHDGVTFADGQIMYGTGMGWDCKMWRCELNIKMESCSKER